MANASPHARIFQASNGFTLLGEEWPDRESVAFGFALGAGSCHEEAHQNGLSALTCEMLMRGSRTRSSKDFHDALDALGVERGESVNASHISLGGATLSDFLEPALELYADAILHPRFPEDQLEQARLVILQEIQAAEDDPGGLALQDLGKAIYPDAWGRPSQGEYAQVSAMDLHDVIGFHARNFRPKDAILTVAGRFEWDKLVAIATRLFGEWEGSESASSQPQAIFTAKETRPFDTQQHHFALAFQAVPFGEPEHMAAWAAVGILGGGGNSRLFSELRDKRGLCYGAYATVHSFKGSGAVICQVATSDDKFASALEVTLDQIAQWAKGIEAPELDRLKARIKSGLILQQESSSARASAIARDWYFLGRVRTVEEIGSAVDELTARSVNAYLSEHPVSDIAIAALGPDQLPHFLRG